jgi:hypothetical protein
LGATGNQEAEYAPGLILAGALLRIFLINISVSIS